MNDLDDIDAWNGRILVPRGQRVTYIGHTSSCLDPDCGPSDWAEIGISGTLIYRILDTDESATILFDGEPSTKNAMISHIKVIE